MYGQNFNIWSDKFWPRHNYKKLLNRAPTPSLPIAAFTFWLSLAELSCDANKAMCCDSRSSGNWLASFTRVHSYWSPQHCTLTALCDRSMNNGIAPPLVNEHWIQAFFVAEPELHKAKSGENKKVHKTWKHFYRPVVVDFTLRVFEFILVLWSA